MSQNRLRGVLKEHSSALNVIFHMGDWFMVALTGWLAHWYYLGRPSLHDRYEIALLVGVLLTALIFPRFNIYRAWRGASLIDELRLITLAWGAVIVSLVAIAFVTKMGATYSRGWALIWAGSSWLGLMASRVFIRNFLSWMRARGFNQRRIVIVGAAGLGQEVATRLQAMPWAGLQVVGFFCDDETLRSTNPCGFPVLGRLEDLPGFVGRESVDQVWLAMPLSEEDRVRSVLHSLRYATVDIRFVPDVFGLRLLNHSVTDVAGMPVMNLSVSPMEGINRLIKGLEDRVLALLILVLISPFLLVIG